MTPRYRRLEALPLDWDQLTEKQKGAIKVVAELLHDAVQSLDSREKNPTTKSAVLDRDRRSQIAFIDGDRGMGKSTVLLSIQDLLTGHKVKDKLGSDYIHVRKLVDIRKRFVWLDTLDMEPLSRHSNILAAIMARISEKFRPGDFDNVPRMAAFDGRQQYEEIVMDLNNLQSTAVRAWTGTPPTRAARVDPMSYADEVLKSEVAGLDLNHRLTNLLEKLSGLFTASGSHQDPIFIIPVDDFDLAPSRCLELLRIIRMVTTPRLFFLVAGNTRIAEEVLRLQCGGELAEIAGEQMASIEAAIIRDRGIEIAANNLRKLVPPEQRAALKVMTIEEARDFCPGNDKRTLARALEEITFNRNNANDKESISLYKFLLIAGEDARIGYSGAGWVTGTPRQVLDRTAALTHHSGLLLPPKDKNSFSQHQGVGKELLKSISEELQREINEDTRITFNERKLLFDLFDIEQLPWNFATVLESDQGSFLAQYIEDEALTPNADSLISARHSRLKKSLVRRTPRKTRWHFRGQDDPELRATAAKRYIPERIAAGAVFLHDLAISLWGGYIVPSGIFFEIMPRIRLAEMQWKIGQETARVAWHIPEWWTVREYERFYARWREISSQPRNVDSHAKEWLAAQLEVLMDKPMKKRSHGIEVAEIRAFLKQLVKERPQRMARRYLRESALVTTILLLCPESGLSLDFASEMIEYIGNGSSEVDDKVAGRVRIWRAHIFKEYWQGGDYSPEIASEKARFLAMLGPAVLEMAMRNLRREASKISIADPKLVADFASLQKVIEPSNPRNSNELRRVVKDFSKGSNSENILRRLIKGFGKSANYRSLCQELETFAEAVESPCLWSGVNIMGDGRFAPSWEEIEKMRYQKDSTARYNP